MICFNNCQRDGWMCHFESSLFVMCVWIRDLINYCVCLVFFKAGFFPSIYLLYERDLQVSCLCLCDPRRGNVCVLDVITCARLASRLRTWFLLNCALKPLTGRRIPIFYLFCTIKTLIPRFDFRIEAEIGKKSLGTRTDCWKIRLTWTESFDSRTQIKLRFLCCSDSQAYSIESINCFVFLIHVANTLWGLNGEIIHLGRFWITLFFRSN